MAVTGESQLRKLLMRSLIEVQMLRQSIKQELQASGAQPTCVLQHQTTPAPAVPRPEVHSKPSLSPSSPDAAPLTVPPSPAQGNSTTYQHAGHNHKLDALNLFTNQLFSREENEQDENEDWGGWVSAGEVEHGSYVTGARTPRKRTPRSRGPSKAVTPSGKGLGAAAGSATSQAPEPRTTPLRSALNALNAGHAGLRLGPSPHSPSQATGENVGSRRRAPLPAALRRSVPAPPVLSGSAFRAAMETPRGLSAKVASHAINITPLSTATPYTTASLSLEPRSLARLREVAAGEVDGSTGSTGTAPSPAPAFSFSPALTPAHPTTHHLQPSATPSHLHTPADMTPGTAMAQLVCAPGAAARMAALLGPTPSPSPGWLAAQGGVRGGGAGARAAGLRRTLSNPDLAGAGAEAGAWSALQVAWEAGTSGRGLVGAT